MKIEPENVWVKRDMKKNENKTKTPNGKTKWNLCWDYVFYIYLCNIIK